MSRRYFGTDGIRGRVGQAPISADFALRLGRAVGKVLAADGTRSIVIGKDTRISGYMFESALEAGLSAAGANIYLLGPMPTPGIAYLTQTLRASAGIVISASHNPYYDNGFKFFSTSGEKLSDAQELAIEAAIDEPFDTVAPDRLGKATRVEDAAGRYIEFCKSTVSRKTTLAGLRIVADCANGATYHVAPQVLRELGAQVETIGTHPNGLNINDECGSTSLGALRKAVLEQGADLGVAFDGDGDRVQMIDERGEPLDGDEILFMIARSGQEQGLFNGGVVGTLMTNFGVEQALRDRAIPFVRAAVGDRYVLTELKSRGWTLGGEGSGHIICLDKTSTGDGIVSALAVLEHLVTSGLPLSQARQGVTKFPQVMVNVPVARKVDLTASICVQDALSAAESRLAGAGRVVLRPSGTEPVVRVTVEGRDDALVREVAGELAAVVQREFAA